MKRRTWILTLCQEQTDIPEKDQFPEVLKAITAAISAEIEELPLADSLPLSDIPCTDDPIVPEKLLEATSLTNRDWQKAQKSDHNLSWLIRYIDRGQRPPAQQVEAHNLDSRYIKEWPKLVVLKGVLHRKTKLNNQECLQLVLPPAIRPDIFRAYHDDLGHQGRDRTLSLIKSRFYWPGMDKGVQDMVRRCKRCICRKTAPFYHCRPG